MRVPALFPRGENVGKDGHHGDEGWQNGPRGDLPSYTN